MAQTPSACSHLHALCFRAHADTAWWGGFRDALGRLASLVCDPLLEAKKRLDSDVRNYIVVMRMRFERMQAPPVQSEPWRRPQHRKQPKHGNFVQDESRCLRLQGYSQETR